MILTIELGWTVFQLDLGEPSPAEGIGWFDNGDIGLHGGNLNLEIDGQEYGSLFVYAVDGVPRIELGQFHPEHDEWRPANPLIQSVPDLVAEHDRRSSSDPD